MAAGVDVVAVAGVVLVAVGVAPPGWFGAPGEDTVAVAECDVLGDRARDGVGVGFSVALYAEVVAGAEEGKGYAGDGFVGEEAA